MTDLTNKKPNTVKQVTEFIRQQTGDTKVELVHGRDGFYYFSGGRADGFRQQTVMTMHLRLHTYGSWLDEYNMRLLDAHEVHEVQGAPGTLTLSGDFTDVR